VDGPLDKHSHHQLSALQVIRSPNVASLLVAALTLYTGVMLQATALGKHVYDITGRELDIGWLGLAEFLPVILLVLVTGSVADRFNRKRVAMWSVAGEATCALLLMWYALTDPTSAIPIFGMAFFFGVARAFLTPALRPIAPMIAPEGGLTRVIAFYSATWTGAVIIGPAVSGFLYAVDPAFAYATAGVLMIIGMLSLGVVRLRVEASSSTSATSTSEISTDDGAVKAPKPERITLASALEGLSFIRRTPILFAVISLDLFAVLFGGAVALLPVIAEQRLGVGDVAYGWLRAAGGIGAALMAIWLALRPIYKNVSRNLYLAIAVFGVATIVLGLTRSYVVAFFAVLVLSAADMISVFIRASIVPMVTPDSKRGRVSAAENVFIGASNELGAFESGAVSSLVGTPATVVGGGVATLVVVGTWWFAFPSLRGVKHFEDLNTGEDSAISAEERSSP
jgi:MFS family permease